MTKSQTQNPVVTGKKPTLKNVEVADSFINIYFVKEDVIKTESANGFEYSEVTLGEYVFLINSKFVHETSTGKYSVGLNLRYSYALKGTDSSVKGVDLKNYYFELKKQEAAK